MDSAAHSGAAEAGAGLSEHYTPRSAAFPAAADCAGDRARSALDQDGAVGKVEASRRFRGGVLAQLSCGAMAICELLDDAWRTELVFRDGLLRLFRPGRVAIRSVQI